MFIIGIDPHKGSHTVAVIDCDEQVVGELSLQADRRQRDRLLGWAAPFEPRLWAVEGATGHGALLAQQLVASGETVVDIPAALSARARLLDAGRKDKEELLGGDVPPAEALRIAQRWMRSATSVQIDEYVSQRPALSERRDARLRARDQEASSDPPENYSDPEFWAAFVAYGA